MPTAMFQCSDIEISKAVLIESQKAPCNIVQAYTYPAWYIFSFDGACDQVYFWAMDLVPKYAGKLAFIGIDELSYEPDDPYKLVVLTDLPYMRDMRTPLQRKYLSVLQVAFIAGMKDIHHTRSEIHTVCERCGMGMDMKEVVDNCSSWIYHMSCMSSMASPYDMLDQVNVLAGINSATMVRCMAHFCYLSYHTARIPTMVERIKFSVLDGIRVALKG